MGGENSQSILKQKEELEKEIYKLKNDNAKEIKTLKAEIQALERKNAELQKEASKYQSALGAAIDLQLSDNDENNLVNLKNDILILQDSLEDYVTNCKGDIELDIPKIQTLLKKYGSQTVVAKDQKPLIKAVLQRHVMEQILNYAHSYIDNPKSHQGMLYGIETKLHLSTKLLLDVARDFANRRVGDDDTTKLLHIKLRQQLFGALGNRGFNDMINNEKKIKRHEFIIHFKGVLNEEIGRYRKINDPHQKNEVEEMAAEIIRKVVKLFFFRFQVQEPVARHHWCKYGSKIDDFMEGVWEEDEINDLIVDVCYFPLIAQQFVSNDKSKCQIFTPAKVITKHR
ncbi:11262_t:CDS:1 [Funneliformis mosseae]|uniref:11262_t:CDS:1 n=1 Tax=Funneliformis mosseae TaxID=27381 RepID=A0A9N9GFA3_FUNMO|nr:11262_t:CDS:1 [Funneliformis mosseae]